MKSNILTLSVLCAFALFLFSCSGDDTTTPSAAKKTNCIIHTDSTSSNVNTYFHNSAGQLTKIESINSSGNKSTATYTWNSNGTIAKIQHDSWLRTFTYDGNYRSVVFQSGGPSTTTVSSMHMKGQDTMWRYMGTSTIPIQMFIQKYKNGNVSEEEFYADYTSSGTLTYGRTTTYTYDDKLNPYRNHPTDEFIMPNTNNVIKTSNTDGDKFDYVIDYDADGYPILIDGPNKEFTITYTCD